MATKNEVKKDNGTMPNARQMHDLFKRIVSLDTSDRQASKEIVAIMAQENMATLTDLIDRIVDEVPGMADRAKRMAACARAGLLDAYHLYGPIRKLTHLDIMTASKSALAAIEDPAGELKVLQDDGSAINKPCHLLKTTDLRRAWDSKAGELPLAEQKRRMNTRKALPKKAIDRLKVKSVRREDFGALVEIDGVSQPLMLTKKDLQLIQGMLED